MFHVACDQHGLRLRALGDSDEFLGELGRRALGEAQGLPLRGAESEMKVRDAQPPGPRIVLGLDQKRRGIRDRPQLRIAHDSTRSP
jgi:hypothetical protein